MAHCREPLQGRLEKANREQGTGSRRKDVYAAGLTLTRAGERNPAYEKIATSYQLSAKR